MSIKDEPCYMPYKSNLVAEAIENHLDGDFDGEDLYRAINKEAHKYAGTGNVEIWLAALLELCKKFKD